MCRSDQLCAAGDPPEPAFSLHQPSSPAQREISQKQPPPPFHRAASRSGSSLRNSLLRPSIEQPRAAGDPPEAASSALPSSSPAQQELPQKEPPLSLYRAAPRSWSSPGDSLPPPSHVSIRSAPRSGSSPRKSLISSISKSLAIWRGSIFIEGMLLERTKYSICVVL